MATIIAFNNSSSMMRRVGGHSSYSEEQLNFFQLAKIGIKQLLQHISVMPLEYVSLVTYSSRCESQVDFTRDYDVVRVGIDKVRIFDSTDLINLLKNITKLMLPNWGKQCPQKVCIFTDETGIVEVSKFLVEYSFKEQNLTYLDSDTNDYTWIEPLRKVKINFILMGVHSSIEFQRAVAIYRELIFFLGLRGQLFIPKPFEFLNQTVANFTNFGCYSYPMYNFELGRNEIFEIIEHVDQNNYKVFETLLKIGDPCRTEATVIIWPAAMPHNDENGIEVQQVINPVILICGYILKTDIGHPESLSHHLILEKNLEYDPKLQEFKDPTKSNDNASAFRKKQCPCYLTMNEAHQDSVVVLLYNALKANNYYALVLLRDNWFGLIYPYSDSRNKEALMLMILQPGNNVIPWIGDFRQLITYDNAPSYFNQNQY